MSKAPHLILSSILMFAFLVSCSQAPVETPTQTSSGSQPTAYPAEGNNSASNPAQGDPAYPAPANSPTGYPAPGGAILQVTSTGGQNQPFAAADLSQLPKVTVENVTGPKLADVLRLAGINDFTSLTVVGSNGSQELTKDKVTGQVIINLDNNTFILVVAGTQKEKWIKDITTIAVK